MKPRLVNGFHSKAVPRARSRWNTLLKFLLGLFLGTLVASQLQNVLIHTEDCILKLPVQRNLKVNVVEKIENAAPGRQLLLVGVMTAEKYIGTRAKAVYDTWGRSVPGKILFFTSEGSDSLTTNNTSEDLPVVRLKGVDDSYPPQKKSFMMLKYMYEKYGDKYEWFMRADDDVFVKTERLELFLRNINSSKPMFIGQAGKGIVEEFGLLSLEYDENFCMGGPGMIMSHVTLSRVAPNVKSCLKNLYTTHEDVEVGRCVQKFAGIPCTWSYEMQNIFYHNSSGRAAFTGQLKSREVHRAITMHPIKDYPHMYRLHNYIKGMSIREKIYEGLKIRREIASLTEDLKKRLEPGWDPLDFYELDTLGLSPSLNKYIPENEDEILTWNFISRAIDSTETLNPRRSIDAPLREGVEDIIREVMESINSLSKERGRVIDFKELLYGYYRVHPRLGVDYILDLLLMYKKYRGRKMVFPVRRHAYLQQAFGPLAVRQSTDQSKQRINFILPLSGRLTIFQRFLSNFLNVSQDEDISLIIVLYPTFKPEDPVEDIKELVRNHANVHVLEQSGNFARASALEIGSSTCQDDCLLFFIDVDMKFDKKTLEHVRMHTIKGRQVYFPIVYSQFDTSFQSEEGKSEEGIDDDKGYWRFYGFGITSLYKSDFERVGGMNTSIVGWGQEDVDLYDRMVACRELSVFRAPDTTLVHVFHAIECDEKLAEKQMKMCRGSKEASYASQRRLAQFYLDRRD